MQPTEKGSEQLMEIQMAMSLDYLWDELRAIQTVSV